MMGMRSSLPKAPLGKLSEEERNSSAFSRTLVERNVDVKIDGHTVSLPVGFMGPPEAFQRGRDGPPIPVAIAISGERQKHVSKFFQSWCVENRGWVTATPMLPHGNNTHFFKSPSDELLRALATHLLETLNVEGGKFHVVGTSNGGTSTFRFGCRWPELCHSLTIVTGSLTMQDERRIDRIQGLPIAIWAGTEDELGFCEAAKGIKQYLDESKISPPAELHIVPGAGHFSIGQFLDKVYFWQRLERLRPTRAASEPVPEPAAATNAAVEAAEATEGAK
eukprot:Hpha_TRINITY_DN16805_c1_g2::TRINITY_DN16805_c1_g2_i1::g.150911::m.150911